MYEKMSRTKKIAFLVAICLANFATMGEMFFTPIIYNVYDTFQSANITLVNTIVSGPNLIVALVSLLFVPTMIHKLGTKMTLIIGGLFFSVFGTAGYFAESAALLLVCRLSYAIGVSIITSAATTMIAEVCQKEDDRTKVMGYYHSAMNGLGAVISLVAGYVAVSNWKNPFLMYLVGFVMVILFVVFLPRTEQHSAPAEAAAQVKSGSREALGVKYWLLVIGFFVFNIAFGVTLFYGSVFTAEHGLGDSSFAGLLSTINTLGSVLACLFYGQIYTALKDKCCAVFYLLGGLGMILPALIPTTVVTLISYFLLGASFGLVFAYAFAEASLIVPESRIADAMSICTFSYAFGGFLTTYFVTLVQGILKTDLVTPLYLVSGVISLVLTAYELIRTRKK